MEDNGSRAKPLRNSANAAKDLENIYGKSGSADNKQKNKNDGKGQDFMDIEINNEEQNEELKAGEEAREKPENEELKDAAETESDDIQQAEKLSRENEELKTRLKSMAAEMENFRKRSLKEKQELIEYANDRLLFKLLPILDDLGKALDAANKNSDYQALLKGIEMINQKSEKLFEEAGVQPMENPVGKPFNVDFHEAVMATPSDEIPEEHVVYEVEKGYMIYDKVLRHAKVVTSSGQENKEGK